jgi:Na+-driven multidrug efflux pump
MAKEFEQEDKEPSTTFGKTMKYIRLGVPSVLCTIVIFLQESMNLSFAGHMNKPSIMAGIGLGNMTLNLFAITFVDAMNQVIEVLVSQAYGNSNKELCGVYLNRGRFMQILLYLPITYVVLNISQFYIKLG